MRRSILLWALFLTIILGLSLAACKGKSAETKSPTAVPTAEGGPTRITDVGLLATHVWAQPTTVIQVQVTPEAATSTPATADSELTERGKGIFEKKNCIQCHGAKAEGMQGKGAKLAGTKLTEAEFEDILRTGGKGRLGNDHIFGPSAISPSGIEAVYAFVRSLAP